jgi:DNA-binding XRE family transcriptional regulator
MARTCYKVIDAYEATKETITARIAESEEGDAVAYRQALASFDAKKDELAKVVESAKKALAEFEEGDAFIDLNAALDKAIDAVRTDADVTKEKAAQAVERVRSIAKKANSDAAMAKVFGFDTGDWSIPVPTAAGQRNAANRSGEDVRFFPAFSSVTVDGKDIDPIGHKLSKELKVSRDSWIRVLEDTVGGKAGWQELKVGDSVSFVVLTGKDKTPHRVTVVKTVKGADDNESAANVEKEEKDAAWADKDGDAPKDETDVAIDALTAEIQA